MVGDKPDRGNVLVRKAPESLRRRVSDQGIVWSGKSPSENCPSGNCPTVTKILEFQLIRIVIPS